MMSSPWKASPQNDSSQMPQSLTDIMSEQLASELSSPPKFPAADFPPFEITSLSIEEESDDPGSSSAAAIADTPTEEASGGECNDDLMMAMLLQKEFDREYDKQLSVQERQRNKNDKVQISYEKYRMSHPQEESDTESEDEDYREQQTSKRYDPTQPRFGADGLAKRDGIIISKHDAEVTARKNCGRVMKLPFECMTGDADDMELKLNNRVFNSLKTHANSEQKRKARVRDKADQATSELAIDERTRLLLFKMIEVNLLTSLGGQIATGKESTVLHAFGGYDDEHEREVPVECAVKVFKTTLNEFKNRIDYCKDDYRFKNPRKLLKIWAEKEKLNLRRMARAGIACPDVVRLKNHVLVLSFIGTDGRPAPHLHKAALDSEELEAAYAECVAMIKTMYHACSLVHADLSEYNILYHHGKCWFIDVSQAVDLSHPRSLIFLVKDCQNVVSYFGRQGVEVPNERELFCEITGLQFDNDHTFITELDDFLTTNRTRDLRDNKKNPADADMKAQARDVLEAELYDQCDD
jgi:RIO kinase 3